MRRLDIRDYDRAPTVRALRRLAVRYRETANRQLIVKVREEFERLARNCDEMADQLCQSERSQRPYKVPPTQRFPPASKQPDALMLISVW
jgi:hypothetical protein